MVEHLSQFFLGMVEEEQRFIGNIEFEDRDLDEEQSDKLVKIYEKYIGYGRTG